MDLVVGLDAGGTASKAVVSTVDGVIVGRGSAGAGNPLSTGAPAAAAMASEALRAALGRAQPSSVVRGVLGVAGASALAGGDGLAAYEKVWRELGLTCPMVVVGDAVTAFAAGSPAPAGVVLIAGTGAIAAQVRGEQVVRTADGHGWLLGDVGSGRWIGLAALRTAVREWSSPFAAAIAAHVGSGSADEMIRWAQDLPFAEIDALAPLVCALARQADPHARAITAEAAAELISTLDGLGAAGPVVLAGGLLAADTPVRDGVRAILRGRRVEPVPSRDPAAAAAWLAARPLSGRPATALHARFLSDQAAPHSTDR
ncbi:N-acetylglucosamine kinase [Paractinoplanes abujensis]|uniref:N-acetylglucosamine kinase-like BadF-type ATPase n=1 Tax=Paractinoplanes abujensis TaxID=882441 RepID=A0A7W7FZ33_9ACTN|nr:BadF/BadG/BcrA/BcrD ATPase family protein [Actinoplanes abujensis]MBB4691643.1 N-acetylglucosamine kinase-like BadF-type ATPase [Actinoplanes abujensis]GID16938.1 N-acetylglucosamine kinase [Actinoplanes abujensis]